MSRVGRAPNLPFDEVYVWDENTGGVVGSEPWRVQYFEDHVTAGGYSRTVPDVPEPTVLLSELEARLAAAQLNGRGGAAFPTLAKLRSVAAAVRRQDVHGTVVANGAEGEPLSYKDRYLLRYRPHMILDGLLLAAAAVDADVAYVYVNDADAISSITAAADELDAKRSGLPSVELFTAQDTYVAGEETAAVREINTGIARPTDKPPRPYQQGVGGAPTLVLNVETLAWLARSVMDDTPGRASGVLATVSGTGLTPRLYEIPTGLPMGEVVRHYTGRESSRWNVLMGGFFGGILPVWPRMALSFEEVRRRGSSLGCSALHFLDPSVCPVRVVADVVAYFAEHNARQCRSCMSSSTSVACALASLGRPAPDAGYEAKFSRWSTQLRGIGACAVPDGVAMQLRTLLRHYPETVAQHIDEGCSQCVAADYRNRWENLSLVGTPSREQRMNAVNSQDFQSLVGAK